MCDTVLKIAFQGTRLSTCRYALQETNVNLQDFVEQELVEQRQL